MGRKNKTKIQKSLSHSGTLLDSPKTLHDGHTSENVSDVVASMKVNMRELVGRGNQNVNYIFSELEKKSCELDVAKKLIKQLQRESSSGQSGTEYTEHVDNDLQEKINRNLETVAQMGIYKLKLDRELNQVEKKVEVLKEERSDLENQLDVANTTIDRLQSKENKRLESLQPFLDDVQELTNAVKKKEEDLFDFKKVSHCASQSHVEILKERNDATTQLFSEDLTSESEVPEYKMKCSECSKMQTVIRNIEENEKERNQRLEDVLNTCALQQKKIIELEASNSSIQTSHSEITSLLEIEKSTQVKLEQKVNECNSEKSRLEIKLANALSDVAVAQENFNHLKTEMTTLNNECHSLASVLEEREIIALKLENELKYSIRTVDEIRESKEAADKTISLLTSQLERTMSDCVDVAETFEKEEQLRKQLETELEKKNAELEKINEKMTAATAEVVSLKIKMSKLEENGDIAEQLQTMIKREKILKEKCEMRFENINNGVQQIKKEFSHVKTCLSDMEQKNKELQLQLTASKADTKYYREDGDHCRKYIKKLETQIVTLTSSDDFGKTTDFELELLSIRNELKEGINSEREISVLDEVKNMKNTLNCQKVELISLRDELSTLKTTLSDSDGEIGRLEEEFIKIHQDNRDKIKEEKIIASKLTEELIASKTLIKNLRKERDNSMKRWKKAFENLEIEKNLLATKAKELEDIVSEATNSSVSDVSLRSVSDKSVGVHHKDVPDKENVTEDSSNRQMIRKEDVSITQADAEQALISEYEIKLSESYETNASLNSRVLELQSSTCALQEQYVEDLLITRQKLENAEDALGVQQEMNAKMEAVSEELKQNHNTVVGKLMKENEQVNDSLKKSIQKINELKDDRVELVKKMESEIEIVESAKQQTLEELRLCKISLSDTIGKLEFLQKEVTVYEENEINKEALGDTEKTKMREEIESLKLKLEGSEKSLADQKVSFEKNLETKMRKQKKLIKEAEQKWKEAEIKCRNTDTAFLVMTSEVDELKTIVQVVRAEDQSKLLKIKKHLEEEKKKSDSLRASVEQVKTDNDLVVHQKNKEIEKMYAEKEDWKGKYGQLNENLAVLVNNIDNVNLTTCEDNLFAILDLHLKRQSSQLLAANSSLAATDEKKIELEAKNQQMRKEAEDNKVEVHKLRERIVTLEIKNSDLIAEHAKERSGLVTELCTAIEKNADVEKLEAIRNQQIPTLERQMTFFHKGQQQKTLSNDQNVHQFDELFRDWNPSARHLAHLFLDNRNVQYGTLAVITYVIFIHLYLLL